MRLAFSQRPPAARLQNFISERAAFQTTIEEDDLDYERGLQRVYTVSTANSGLLGKRKYRNFYLRWSTLMKLWIRP